MRILFLAISLLFTQLAHAGFIRFDAQFWVDFDDGVVGQAAVGNEYYARIDVFEDCGDNYQFGCGNFNAILDVNIGGFYLGPLTGWDVVFISAMARNDSGKSPFGYDDPVFDDVIFDFFNRNQGQSSFRAGTGGADDNTWVYVDNQRQEMGGTFVITRRIPEPISISLFSLGLVFLAKKKAKLS
ncbi:MAG: hypothetical protein Alis3KO_06750 [Aliiglaciecola sp.]